MRKPAIVAGVVAVLLAAGCGSKTKTVTQTAPGQTVTVTETATTPATTTTSPTAAGGEFRKPKAGDSRLTISATVAHGEVRKTSSAPSDFSQYTYIELQPNDGSSPLRVAAAGDLALPAGVANALVNPGCAGKLRGTFTVMPAGRPSPAYDWELLSAQLTRTTCGP